MKKMKKTTMLLAAIFVIAALAAGCGEPSGGAGGAGEPIPVSAGKGAVRLLIGGGSAARTLMPETPVFTSYTVVFTMVTPALPPPVLTGPITKSIPTADIAAPVVVELDPGTWKIEVTGYALFTPTGGSATEYAAAYGHEDTVSILANLASAVSITITPIPVGATVGTDGIAQEEGILSYSFTYPTFGDAAVTGTLTLKRTGASDISETLPATTAGETGPKTATGTLAVTPGYYDLFISLTKTYTDGRAPRKAGQYLAAHIYSGLETKAGTTGSPITFADTDFVITKFLAGTITIIKPAGVSLSGVTITALTGTPTETSGVTVGATGIGADATPPAGTSLLSGGSTGTPSISGGYVNSVGNIVDSPWILEVPVDTTDVWFLLAAKDNGSGPAQKTFWTANVHEGSTGSPIPDHGRDAIALRMNILGLTVNFTGLPGDEITDTMFVAVKGSGTGLTTPGTQTTNTLSWKDGDDLTITVGTGTEFASYTWYLDGVEITDPNTATGITTDGNIAAYIFKTTAQKLTVGGHILTCRVTTKTGTAAATGVPDGTAYSKNLVFKVAQ